MQLGTCILLLTLFHPVDVAEQITSLDHICGGRFIFGIGLGYLDTEFHARRCPTPIVDQFLAKKGASKSFPCVLTRCSPPTTLAVQRRTEREFRLQFEKNVCTLNAH